MKLSSHVNKISFGEEGIRLKYSFMELKGKVVVPFVVVRVFLLQPLTSAIIS